MIPKLQRVSTSFCIVTRSNLHNGCPSLGIPVYLFNQKHKHHNKLIEVYKKRKGRSITYHNKKLEKSAPFASLMAAKKSSQVTACPSCLLKYRSMPYNVKKLHSIYFTKIKQLQMETIYTFRIFFLLF